MSSQSETLTVYIPITGNLTERDIMSIFWEQSIGTVRRVDFVNDPQQLGNKSAFVHLHQWCRNNHAFDVCQQIQLHGSCKYWYSQYNYLILRKLTTDPIPDTSLNIHQIAAQLLQHETKIAELEAKLSQQEKEIQAYRRQQIESLEYGRMARRALWDYTASDDSYDVDIEDMVDSLIGPRWPDDDDTGLACVHPEKSDDEMSIESVNSNNSNNSKRIQTTAELCGNN